MVDPGSAGPTATATTALSCAVGFVLLSTLFANVWLRYFTRGPLEALMRLMS